MGGEEKVQKRPEGVLQNVITYLCFKVNPNSYRKLMKLVYLVDVYHYEMFGERLTDVPFKHYDFGAFAPEVYWCLEELYEVGMLKDLETVTRSGHKAIVPKPAVKRTLIELPDSGFEALERVIKEWGSAMPDVVVEFTKRSLPFLGTEYGEEIEFSRVDPIIAYAKKRGVSASEAATDDVLANDTLVEAILEGDQAARKGVDLLDYTEVFED